MKYPITLSLTYSYTFFQAVIGDLVNIHKSSVCRIIKRVCYEIAKLRRKLITLPSTIEEIQQTKVGFYKMHKNPQVIGVINCTHIRIQSPCQDVGEQYRNRKFYFSFNVQAVCNSNLEITDTLQGNIYTQNVWVLLQ
jgi:hypothetical protein